MILNLTGGGGAALNFKVVGNPKPSNPKENTVWVNTNIDIPSWIFSAIKPENPVYGMVWFSVGTSSNAEFNSLKKNGIMVYPISASQYIGGEWVSVTATSYQGGAWVDWIEYLYNKGDLCNHITGGWNTRGWTLESGGGRITKAPTITYNSNAVVISMPSASAYHETGIWETQRDIDLTDVLTIRFHILYTSRGSGSSEMIRVGAFTRSGTYVKTASVAYVDITSSGNTNRFYDVDVGSLSGAYDIGVALNSYAAGAEVSLDEIQLIGKGGGA